MARTITVVSLATSQKDFDKLHHQVAANRVDVGTTVVDKKALMHLLYDHSQLVGVIEEEARHIRVKLEHGDREAEEESLLALQQYRDVVIEKQIDLKQENLNLSITNNTASPIEVLQSDTEIYVKVIENDEKTEA